MPSTASPGWPTTTAAAARACTWRNTPTSASRRSSRSIIPSLKSATTSTTAPPGTYAGLDEFGRVKDLLWRNYGTSQDVVRIKHGYDRAGNRLWREDAVAAAQSPPVHLDELYTYDGINRLIDAVRGDLNANKDGLVPGTKTFAEAWGLDPTGNWSSFNQDTTGGGWALEQTRDHNPVNEITDIDETTGPVLGHPIPRPRRKHDRDPATRATRPSSFT